MNGRLVGIVLAYVAFWVVAWAIATAPGRDSAEIFQRFRKSTARDATPIVRELTAVYADSPRQASADYAAHPEFRLLIAQSAAPVPECLPVVEEALVSLPPEGRLVVLLALAINGTPTLDERNSWTGSDPLQPRPDALPTIRRHLEREPVWTIALLAAQALAAAGDRPSADVLFERSKNTRRALVARSSELIVLADRKGGAAELMRALRDSLIPDDAATALVISGVLDRDPAWKWKPFALDWATSPAHASAAGGAFPTLYDLLPAERDRIWSAVSSAPRGSRVPLMVALMKRSNWPASYRNWWMGVYDDERKLVPDLEDRLAAGDLASFGRWAAEEQDPRSAMAIRAVLERLRAASARTAQGGR
ncbi:MAG: hypothetical protein FD180_1718 [Planctomycetota bacterium]|nr:MAG: hypothetical protein FD180_1718 [Planctomycetota bacterium]